jgi:hypothetical protein
MDKNVTATTKEVLQMQLVDVLAIAIAAILAIATILAVNGLIEKLRLSCATLLKEVVLNYIYSKLRTLCTLEMA